MNERIVVGMSGGVDSSVAALLLKEQGYDVLGVFMKNWEEQDESGACTSESDWRDVQAVCDEIGIPYYSVNFVKEYYDSVFSYFLDEYKKGRTPNPDVLCNREIKFKAFLDFAMKLGANRMATGHFVQTNEQGQLLKGADANKDQSYFLYMLKSWQLKKALFPVGGMCKEEVRAYAEKKGLPVFAKKDSTGVCFIGERHFKTFLKQFLPATPGDMVSTEGEKLGRHDGLMYYTLGQRKGLGIGGRGDGRSWFVIEKDLTNNRLIVAQGEDHALLYSNAATGTDVTWIGDKPAEESFDCMAKFRYRQKDQKVRVTQQENSILVEAQYPQRALTPGQSMVLYSGEKCLGGAILDEVIKR